MSIAPVTGNSSQLAAVQRQYQQVRSQFKQLGQDLQSGSLAQAQTDFVTLSQSVSGVFSGTNPVAKLLGQVGQALQSGNLSAAQQACSLIARVGAYVRAHHSQVPPMGDKLSQGLQQLGQALQSGKVSTAQQAFAAVQQVWQEMSGDTLAPLGTPGQASTRRV